MAGDVPASMDALVKLPGVGRKTANVVLGHALDVPGLPVDRHVLRVANRIGLVHSDDAVAVEKSLLRRPAARPVDPRVRHADPSRPARVPAKAAVRSLPRARRLRVLPRARRESPAARSAPRDASMTRDEFRELVNEALGGDSAELSRRASEHRHRRRGRTVARPAERGRHRAARHAARTLRRHAADRTPVGARQHAAGQDHALSTPHRGRVRR